MSQAAASETGTPVIKIASTHPFRVAISGEAYGYLSMTQSLEDGAGNNYQKGADFNAGEPVDANEKDANDEYTMYLYMDRYLPGDYDDGVHTYDTIVVYGLNGVLCFQDDTIPNHVTENAWHVEDIYKPTVEKLDAVYLPIVAGSGITLTEVDIDGSDKKALKIEGAAAAGTTVLTTFSVDADGKVTFDKTYEELKTALDAGATLVAKDDSTNPTFYNLSGITGDKVTFAGISPDGESVVISCNSDGSTTEISKTEITGEEFKITVNLSDPDNITMDKDFADIVKAYESGKRIVAVDNHHNIYNLNYVNSNNKDRFDFIYTNAEDGQVYQIAIWGSSDDPDSFIEMFHKSLNVDWNAEEYTPGSIENRPFYKEVGDSTTLKFWYNSDNSYPECMDPDTGDSIPIFDLKISNVDTDPVRNFKVKIPDGIVVRSIMIGSESGNWYNSDSGELQLLLKYQSLSDDSSVADGHIDLTGIEVVDSKGNSYFTNKNMVFDMIYGGGPQEFTETKTDVTLKKLDSQFLDIQAGDGVAIEYAASDDDMNKQKMIISANGGGETFKVTITRDDDDSIVSDKTPEEIKTAYNSGSKVIAVYNDQEYQIARCDDYSISFFHTIENEDFLFTHSVFINYWIDDAFWQIDDIAAAYTIPANELSDGSFSC